MDIRWALIIIILIVGLGSMYLIVDNSNTVGSAIVTFGKTTMTLPDGFSVERTNEFSVELYNKQNRVESIDVYDFGEEKQAKTCLKNFTKIQREIEDYDKVVNSSTKIHNVKIYQTNMTNENGTDYFCSFYYQNHTYLVVMENYKDTSKIREHLEFIMDTMHRDYKQSPD